MKKFLSRILALLLVLVLIVNISPIRARAMMPVVGWDGFAWNLAEIIASSAIGIGTSPGSVPDDWNNMIEDAKQACQDFFGFVGDTMKIYRFFDGSCYKYYAKADFVEWLREWMWVDGIVSYSAPNDAEMTDFMRTIYNSVSSHKYAVCWVWEDNMHFAYSDHGKLRIYNGNTSGAAQYYLDRPDGGTFTCFYVTPAGSQSVSQTLSSTRVFADSWMWIGTDNEKEIVSSFDLGYVAPLEVPISEGYPEWVQNSVYIPAEVAGTEEEVLALPLGLGQTLDETQGLNQEQIWAGESTLEVEIEEALEGTVAGTTWATFTQWFSHTWATFTNELIAIKDSILGLPQTIADFFAPSGDITMYSLDLTELFPFCIPFDIFDLLSALRADPVAPVFELELDFGVTKAPITVDLSGWSDLASIIRILEVGLFCLGLALGTKELIGS